MIDLVFSIKQRLYVYTLIDNTCKQVDWLFVENVLSKTHYKEI